jgi:cyclic dehypoxanthinyl futalosine synthase
MMFGHVGNAGDRIEHLERLRVQQDKSLTYSDGPRASSPAAHSTATGNNANPARPVGFTHSSAGRFKPNTRSCVHRQLCTRVFAHAGPGPHLPRQFSHVQSSWVTQGLEIGQVALKFGANDLGSIMIEENVVSQAGTTFA